MRVTINKLLSFIKSIFLYVNKYASYIIFAPNGAKDNFAILKNCKPNGIPNIVIHHIQPKIKFSNAIGIPKNIIHITFLQIMMELHRHIQFLFQMEQMIVMQT